MLKRQAGVTDAQQTSPINPEVNKGIPDLYTHEARHKIKSECIKTISYMKASCACDCVASFCQEGESTLHNTHLINI